MKKMRHYAATFLFVLGAAALFGGTAHAQMGTLPADLHGPTWTLTAMQGPAQDIQDLGSLGVTLRFGDDGRASGQSTCNGYSATAQAGAGSALTFGPIISTKRACVDPDRTALETEYLNALQGVSTYAVTGTQLQLFYTNNNGQSTLTFSSAPLPGMPVTGGLDLALLLAVVAAGAGMLLAGGLALRRGGRILSR